MFYLEQTKMSKYKFAQKSGMPLSTLYDIAKKEDYDIRESNIIKVSRGMSMEPFELFQTNEQILVIQNMQEIMLIQEVRLLPSQYQKIFLSICKVYERLQTTRNYKHVSLSIDGIICGEMRLTKPEFLHIIISRKHWTSTQRM